MKINMGMKIVLGMKIAKPRRARRRATPPCSIEAPAMTEVPARESQQLLHLVLGGELKNIDSMEFKDVAQIDVVGVFPNYESAERPGAPRRKRRSTARRPAISSCICIACWSPTGLSRKVG